MTAPGQWARDPQGAPGPRPQPQPALGAALRSSLGRFATGVCVVTFETPNGAHGLTINSFTSVSMQPALVLVSVAKTARGHDSLVGQPFCVNVLGVEQECIAAQFAGASRDVPVPWANDSGVPRLLGTLAHFVCAPWRCYDGGDHTLFLGEVVSFAYRDGDALGFVGGRYTNIPELRLGHEHLI